MVHRPSFSERFLAAVVGTVGPFLVQLLGASLRVEVCGGKRVARGEGASGQTIYVFWHGQLLTLSYTYRRKGICVLVSRHRDGELIARVLRRLGFETVRGSSSRGGFEGLFEMSRMAKSGWNLALTPDGPRGPRRRARPGVVYLAQRTGAEIVPLSWVASRSIVLDTWDRFEIPLPFSKVIVAEGRPFKVPRDTGCEAVEGYERMLEAALAETHAMAKAALSGGKERGSEGH